MVPRKGKVEEAPITGRTIWDVVWALLGQPIVGGVALTTVLVLLVLVVAGKISVSLSETGLRLSPVVPADVNVAGSWAADAKDEEDANHTIVARYSYAIQATLSQSGSEVTFTGRYRIKEDPGAAERTVSGHGTLNGGYLSLPYDISTQSQPVETTHGVLFIHFQPSGTSATGYYLARSMKDDGFVFGSMSLRR